jgi:hypothetical protein
MAEPIPAELRPHSGELLEIAVPAIPPCIYFLLSHGTVVYVGQTTSLCARIGQHRRDKLFDRVVFLPTPEGELDQTEHRFIRLLKPKYNFHPDRRELYRDAKDETKRLIEAGFVS